MFPHPNIQLTFKEKNKTTVRASKFGKQESLKNNKLISEITNWCVDLGPVSCP